MPVKTLSFEAQREAIAIVRATKMLRDVLRDAAERTAAGGNLSAEDCAKLTTDLLRTLRAFEDAAGWYAARCCPHSVHPMAAAALHDFLRVTAANASVHKLSAENRALIINCVFMALGVGWKANPVPAVAAEQAYALA